MTDRRPIAVTAALLALAMASCGGEPVAEAPGVGAVRAGSVAQLASCGDWRRGSVDERLATIEQVRNQVDPNDSPAVPTMSDQEAYDYFEGACAPEYAGSFRLYKLYGRGASFRSLVD